MKILMLTPYLPYPLHSGGQIRTYNLLKNLSQKHQITLFSFIRSDEEKQYINELKKFCYQVKVFLRRRPWDIRNLLLAAFTPYPFLVSIYLSRKLKQAIAYELSVGNYDLIHAETFYVMPNLPKTNSVPTLLVEQTIEYLVYQKFVETTRLWFLKPLLYLDVIKIKLWEKFFWRQAAWLAAMSESDKKIMQQQVAKKLKINIVANGVDTQFFTQPSSIRQANSTVLFVGNFKWLPNKDAAKFLVNQIWPKILAKLPSAKLLIVGRNPTPDILKLDQAPRVTVKSDVADIRPVLKSASVLLAPIRNGRGTKYKVLEAMASGLPVVTTKLGIEGINCQDSVLVAETSSGLAAKTIKVLSNNQLSRYLAAKAKKIVYAQYNWPIISHQLDTIYQNLGKIKL